MTDSRWTKCPGCFAFHEAGAAHACAGHFMPTYQEYPQEPGCQPLRQLTEEDVRRIVRDELIRGATNV